MSSPSISEQISAIQTTIESFRHSSSPADAKNEGVDKEIAVLEAAVANLRKLDAPSTGMLAALLKAGTINTESGPWGQLTLVFEGRHIDLPVPVRSVAEVRDQKKLILFITIK